MLASYELEGKLVIVCVLWQLLDTKSNDHTMSKSLKADI